MEKLTPHCKLTVVKALVEAGEVRATASAFGGARALGVHDLAGMCAVVLALTSSHFYKSMPPMPTIGSGKTCTTPRSPVDVTFT